MTVAWVPASNNFNLGINQSPESALEARVTHNPDGFFLHNSPTELSKKQNDLTIRLNKISVCLNLSYIQYNNQ